MPFRRLRAAAITDWLVHGLTTEEAADRAGNSQAVLEKHYKGVLATRRPRTRRPAEGDVVQTFAATRTNLDDAQLGAMLKMLKEEQRRRLDADDEPAPDRLRFGQGAGR